MLHHQWRTLHEKLGEAKFSTYMPNGFKLCEFFRHGSFDEMNKESRVVPFDWH